MSRAHTHGGGPLGTATMNCECDDPDGPHPDTERNMSDTDHIDISPDGDAPIIGEILAGLEAAQERVNKLKTEDEAPPEYFSAMTTLIYDGVKLVTILTALYDMREKYPIESVDG